MKLCNGSSQKESIERQLSYYRRYTKWRYRRLMGKIKDELCAVIRMVVLIASMGKVDYNCRSGKTETKH